MLAPVVGVELLEITLTVENETVGAVAAPAPLSPYEEKKRHALEMIGIMQEGLADGVVPTADMVATLMAGEDHPLIRDWVKNNTNITAPELSKAMKNERIRAEFGFVPRNATELVQAIVKRDGAYCTFDGHIVRQAVRPWIDDGKGGKQYVYEAELAELSPFDRKMVEAQIRKNCPQHIERIEFEEIIRTAEHDYRLGFPQTALNDAASSWYRQSKRNRQYDLFSEIAGPIEREDHRVRARQMWLDLARSCFKTDQTITPAFVAAVLQKFMHQVKRKIWDLPIYDHLMPVLFGEQGVGKTTFVEEMLKPIHDLKMGVTFKDVEEERNIEIWDYFVLFLDEMGYASKTNIDTVKQCITAPSLPRRPMRSNAAVKVKQNATFIGCSNKVLEQLIKDPTGIRRFVQLTFKGDWKFLATVNWKLLWESVDHEGPDPMAPFKAVLKDVQEETREMGRVEHWASMWEPTSVFRDRFIDSSNRAVAKELYREFHDFQTEYYPGLLPTSEPEWRNEMKRMDKSTPNPRFRYAGKCGGDIRYQLLF